MNPIYIIGSGLSGYNLARELRKLDAEVPLKIVTADDGHYYSKPQLSNALTLGKEPEGLAMLKKEKMEQQLKAEILTFTKVTHIDPERKEIMLQDSDAPLPYEKLVIAWGAEIIDSKIEGNGLEQVFSVNDLLDYRRFRTALDGKQSVTILGSGLIGCEFANDLINTGHKVTVVSLADTPLDGLLPREASEAVKDSLSKKGVEWQWGATIQSVNQIDGSAQVEVTLNNGATLQTDIVLSAIGLKPRIALAQESGLGVNHGICVNKYLETSQPDIYALGDCAEVCGNVFQYILPINFSAKALAQTLTGTRTAVRYPAMPVSVKTPACPVVVSPPPSEQDGRWRVQQAGSHVKAMYVNAEEQVLGFALTGDRVKERLQMTTLIPPILDDAL